MPHDVETTGSRRHRWTALAWLLVFLAIPAMVQFWVTSVPWDTDTEYHVAVAQLIRTHGILHAFPWTPFSWLSEHYADKELLFHLVLAAFAGLDWISCAKVVGALLGAVSLTVTYFVLRAERVPFAGVWTLVPLAACEVFVFRFSLVRPHLLSISLATVVTWAAARNRLAVVAAASALYPWAYVAWELPLVLVGIVEAARFATERKLAWRPMAAALAGVVAGVALHPNAANLVRLNAITIGEILFRNAWGQRPGLELGSEFEPFSVQDWGRYFVVCVAMTIAAIAVSWRRERRDVTTVAFTAAAVAFGILTVRTARFAEYYAPFSAAAFALASRRIAWRPLPAAVLAASIAYGAPSKLETVTVLGSRSELLPRATAAQLRAAIPEGEQVFTCEWGYTGTMMLGLPGRRFMVALDPTFFYVQDPELYRLWFDLPRQPPPHPAEVIRRRFGARFVMCRWDPRYRKFLNDLAFEPGVRTVLSDDVWNVYALGTP